MTPATMITMKRHVQQGFSLITAIFLLVVITSLGALMMTFFTAQQQSSALDVLDARAYQAARAGFEWGAFQITQSNVAGGAFATGCQGAGSSSAVTLSGTPLSSFNVVVSCFYTPFQTDTNSSGVYEITATANGVNGAALGSTDYVQRVIQATIDGGTASGIIFQRESY